ncbi:MAG: prolyl oligopeptidase family serine peptidase [Acidobacteriota bacterium]
MSAGRVSLSLCLLLVTAAPLSAVEPTLEQVMADPDWIGNAPGNPYWSLDSSAVYFDRKRVGSPVEDRIRIDLADGQERVLTEAEHSNLDVPGGHWSTDRTRRVFARNGDLFLAELGSGAVRQLTRTTARERSPRFMADERRISFRRGDAWLVRELDTGLELEPASLKTEDDPDEKEDDDGYHPRQERRFFEYLRRREADGDANRDRARALQDADVTRPDRPFYLGKKVEVARSDLSPSGRWLLVTTRKKQSDEKRWGEKSPMPLWITESGYVETRDVRAKVGTGDRSTERLWLLDLESGEKHELKLDALPGIKTDPLASLRDAAEAREKERESAKKKKDGDDEDEARSSRRDRRKKRRARPAWVRSVEWNRAGTEALVMIESHDNKDRWITRVDFERARLDDLHHLHDEAWINWRYNDMGWLSDDRTAWWLSEESGWSQLEVRGLDERRSRALTHGRQVVSSVRESPDGRFLYYLSNPQSPRVYDVHRVEVATGRTEAVTTLGGRMSYELSPDGRRLLLRQSKPTRPPELFVQEARPGASARQLTESRSEAFQAMDWVEPRFVEVPSSHGVGVIHSRLYLPPAGVRAPAAKRPAVVFIHGAGYLQNAHEGWSGYFREFMFHTVLANRGYVVLDMDYRASAGYGRDWRTAIYRDMGRPELEDLTDGVRWLVSEQGVERERVGAYGGSYGGFLVLMALFQEPDLFAAGAALRPVTDWAHYNHGYTSNILNVPEIDPEAYRRSSPIEFAEGLEKPLLMCAPMLDDNVHFHDTVRLVQRLIELKKEDWETAIYPVEPHGFRQPTSWLDEYRRIYKLFETHVR